MPAGSKNSAVHWTNAAVWSAGGAWAGWASHAAAQTCAAGASCFTLLGVTVDGATALSPAELSSAYTSYLTRQVSASDLSAIADAITARYRDKGYFLSRAIAPSQAGDGGLALITVFEGKFADVVIQGSGQAQVAPFFEGMSRANLATLEDLDRRLALAGDVPGVTVRARVEPMAGRPNEHRLVVTADFDDSSVYLTIDNRGTKDFGPVQAAGLFSGRDILFDRDQASVLLYTTPQRTVDFSYGEAQYAYSFANGDRLSGSFSASRSENDIHAGALKVGGLSRAISVRYERPLHRRRESGLWADAIFDARHIKNDWLFGGEYVDETRVGRLQLRGAVNKPAHTSTFAIGASFGTAALGGSGPSVERRSRQDADGEFVSYNFNAAHFQALTRNVSFTATVAGQWSDEPLLLSEEFDAGGQPFARAYGAGEISGDSGAGASFELRASFDPSNEALTLAQTYAFADTAKVWNDNASAGEAALSSAGIGFRAKIDDSILLTWEMARPLNKTPFGETDKAWRHLFSVSVAL